MKLVFHLCLLLCLNTTYADLVIEQEVDSEVMGIQKLIHHFKNGKVRLDAGGISVLSDLARLECMTLLPDQKVVMVSKLPAAPEAANNAIAGAVDSITDTNRPKKNGQTAMVEGWACEAWEWNNEFTQITLWVALDYPAFAEFKEEIHKLSQSAKSMIPFALNGEDMNGMVVRIEGITIATKQKTIMTLKGLRFDPIDDSLFAIPADYKEVKLGQ